MSKDTERLLRDLKKQPEAANPTVKNQQRITLSKVANEFSSALNDYQRVQRECIDKEKFAINKGKPGTGAPSQTPNLTP